MRLQVFVFSKGNKNWLVEPVSTEGRNLSTAKQGEIIMV